MLIKIANPVLVVSFLLLWLGIWQYDSNAGVATIIVSAIAMLVCFIRKIMYYENSGYEEEREKVWELKQQVAKLEAQLTLKKSLS